MEGVSFNLEVGIEKSFYEIIEDNVVNVNNWRERFFDVENELKRIKFEKSSIEFYVFFVEVDLERV